jgi:hypothetical protein
MFGERASARALAPPPAQSDCLEEPAGQAISLGIPSDLATEAPKAGWRGICY